MSCEPALVTESDEQLMARVQADDAGAFEQLYHRHATGALGLARRICRDAGRAEDAVQEGFLCMWRGRMDYRTGSGSFKGWAMTIVEHRAIDSIRREGSRPPLAKGTEAADPATAPVHGQMLAHLQADALRASLRRLPEVQAEVIGLAFFGQMTHTEIAEGLSLPVSTIKGRMRIGLEKLAWEIEAAE